MSAVLMASSVHVYAIRLRQGVPDVRLRARLTRRTRDVFLGVERAGAVASARTGALMGLFIGPWLACIAGAVMRRALGLANISQKAAALSMSMPASQASRQLSGEEHLHLDRWVEVPGLAVWLGPALAIECGLPTELDTLVKLRMARMTLAERAEAQRA